MKYRIYSTIDKSYVDNTRNFVLDASGKIRALGGITMNPERGMIAEMCSMQKDKNGAFIYDGDIVKLPSGRNRTIYFENGCFGFNSSEGSFYDDGEVDFITFGGRPLFIKTVAES